MALVLYLFAGAFYIVVRYGIMPNIDHWRPRIQAELSAALDSPVTLGRIDASWKGWQPHFQLNDVAVVDEHGNQALHLPVVRATLSWQGLLSGLPRFSYIEAKGLDIEARRDAQQRIWVLGRNIDAQDPDDSPQFALDHPLVQWLANQPRVALRDAAIRWRDNTRDGSVLRLEAVTLGLVSDGQSHRLILSATPPAQLGRRFEMRGEFNYANPQLERADPMAWEGMLYVNVDGMSPIHWRPWMDLPGHMRAGDVSAKWWLGFAEAKPQRVAAHVLVEQGRWLLGDEGEVAGEGVELFIDGSWPAYAGALGAFESLVAPSAVDEGGEPQSPETKPSLATEIARAPEASHMAEASSKAGPSSGPAASPVIEFAPNSGASRAPEAPMHEGEDGPPVRFWIDARGLALHTPALFEHTLQFKHIAMRGKVLRQANGGFAAHFDNTHVINDDMDLEWQGTWKEGGSGAAGLADIRGVFRRATLDGIDLYMPTSVNLDARQWLTDGLLGGEIENATAVLQGDLEHFPFGDTHGVFRIDGKFRDGIIDYAPGPSPEESWPALRQVSGRVVLDRVDLRLAADEAVVVPADDHAIHLRNILARIPNIEQDSVLSIEGMTRAPAEAYLALALHSPLQRLLDGFLDPATADGDWDVPLKLTIPLLNVDDTQVQGSVNFEGGMVSLDPQAPPFEQVSGKLEFTETGFSADGLKARFLGGPAGFSGGIGGKRKGLDMSGRITAEALGKYVGVKGMNRLAGSLSYQASLRRQNSGRYAMIAHSDLHDLAIDLPAPAGKAADTRRKLEIQWTPAPSAGQMYLKVALGPQLKAWFLRREGAGNGPYFVSAALGTTLPQNLPATGMVVDMQHSRLNVDDWEAVVSEFGTSAAGAAADQTTARQFFPEIHRIRLQADAMQLYGIELNAATVTAQHERPLQWRFDIASAKTAGTVYWREADAGSSGRVDAHFNRLALGPESSGKKENGSGSDASDASMQTEHEEDSWEREVDVPAVSLKVDSLLLYGRPVGKLEVQGVNEQRGRFWRLNELSLVNPSATLRGSGIWRLTGPERGLTLDAEVDFIDLGSFLEQIDVNEFMEKGHGTLKGRFEWRNMPWRFKRADLNGQLRLELEQGRFSTVNSRSARLLELLSLQSLRRLATFSLDPGSIFKEGFPFDRIAGTLHIRDGVLTTNDYQVISPVATISIGGDVDLTTEKIDFQAMVVPKLDVSGGAVAAGIAINPIVGLGAFVTQWLLSKPLSRAMTVHYDVEGDLNAPQLREVAAPAAPALETPHVDHIQGGDITLSDESRNGLHDAKELNGSVDAPARAKP